MPASQWKDAHPAGCIRQMAVFKHYQVIPKYCFECYKVLVTPRNVIELFKLLRVFETIELPLDNSRKCMVERRSYCSGAYKGFLYCRGVEDGKVVQKLVRKAVSEAIAPQLSVALKRGCSEYAQKYPDFAQVKSTGAVMHYQEEWQTYEEAFERNFVFRPDDVDPIWNVRSDNGTSYSAWDIYCMRYWLAYAATIGDTSYMKITGTVLPPIAHLNRPPFQAKIPVKRG